MLSFGFKGRIILSTDKEKNVNTGRTKILQYVILIVASLSLSGCASDPLTEDQSPSRPITTNQNAPEGNDIGSNYEQLYDPNISNSESNTSIPFDADGDGIHDSVDIDPGGDGIINNKEQLRNSKWADPLDYDNDGIPNTVDWDKDGDGFSD